MQTDLANRVKGVVKQSAKAENGGDDDFIDILERGVRTVLGNRKSSASEKLAAVNAGAKLLMIKFKISGEAEESFFK